MVGEKKKKKKKKKDNLRSVFSDRVGKGDAGGVLFLATDSIGRLQTVDTFVAFQCFSLLHAQNDEQGSEAAGD